MRVKMSKQPPPAPTASAISPCPTVIEIVGRPGTGSCPAPLHHSTTPLSLKNPSYTQRDMVPWLVPELWIGRGNEDNLKIIFLISPRKHVVTLH